MSPIFGGSVYSRGKWTSPVLNHGASGVNTWSDLITSGTLPAGAIMQVHIFDEDDVLLLGSQAFNTSIPISGNAAFQLKNLKIQFDVTWITGSPTVKFWNLPFKPAILGDQNGAFTVIQSGGD